MIAQGLTREQANALYLEVLEADDRAAQRRLCQEDLFFLLTIACKRKDIDRDWLYDRCREVEAKPDGYLDLWAREHYKSTIITFGLTIKNILNNPNRTTGIFSHTRPIAKAFLKQIANELEKNVFLKDLFPEILYQDPRREAPKWSLDEGIRVKRTANPKEETVEAWGLVDGQPTSKHFDDLIFDDVVTKESVSTPEQIKKTTDALALAYSLGAEGGVRRFIGTRYHLHDTYGEILRRGSAIKREYPARIGGKIDGAPAFLSEETLQKKRTDMGPYIFSCQMLQNPVADKAMSFKEEWLKFYKTQPKTDGWNIYLLVDPANKKKKTNDYTVILVIGLAPDGNYYLLDAIRDRLNLTQRTEKLFALHRKWKPKKVGYEQYGMQSDVEHIKYVMEEKNYRFSITELGGSLAKEDRIRQLVPKFENSKLWLPESLTFIDSEGKPIDFVRVFIDDEYKAFPVSTHDDMLDCMARILDSTLGAEFPMIEESVPEAPVHYYEESAGAWMG